METWTERGLEQDNECDQAILLKIKKGTVKSDNFWWSAKTEEM